MKNSKANKQRLLPKLPTASSVCTKAAYRFLLQHHQIFDYFVFGVELATSADRSRVALSAALAKIGISADSDSGMSDAGDWERVVKSPSPAFRKLQTFAQYESENIVIRTADNFLSYLSEILQETMKRRPELLRSSEQIKISDVIRFRRQQELIEYVVSRKINELSYGGIRAIEEFFEQRMNLSIIKDETRRENLSLLVELRNIYTHNRGVVNELFPSRLHKDSDKSRFALGKKYRTEFEQIVEFSNNLFDLAQEIDRDVSSKFKLKRKKFSTWNEPRVLAMRAEIAELDAADSAKIAREFKI